MTMKAKDMAVHSGVFRLLSSNSLIMLSLMKLHGKPGITAIGCYGNRHGLLPFVLVRSHRYHVTLPPLPFFFFSVSTSPQNGTTCMCCVHMKYFILESGHHTNSSMPVLRNWLPNLSSIIFFFFFVTFVPHVRRCSTKFQLLSDSVCQRHRPWCLWRNLQLWHFQIKSFISLNFYLFTSLLCCGRPLWHVQ